MSIDLALINGRVHTMAGRQAEAVAVSGNRIISVGSTSDIKSMCSGHTQILDLKGKAVFPGFNDSHMHILLYGSFLDKIDLRAALSIDDVIAACRKFIAETNKKPGEWILGWGWDQDIMKERKFLDKADLDKISTEHPILLNRICGHVGTANSLAIKYLNINTDTFIEGGIFDRDSKGELTGLIREAALEWVMACLPKPDKEGLKRILKLATLNAAKAGLTSIHTDDLDMIGYGILDNLLAAYRELSSENALPVRINEKVQTPHRDILDDFLRRNMRTGYGDDYFKIGPIKLIADGSLGARTAALREDYSDEPGTRGPLQYKDQELNELVCESHKAGMQVAIHAIGDAAVASSIKAFKNAISTDGRPARHRIVHCQIADAGLYREMAAFGIIADIQPSFVASDWDIVEKRVGVKRAIQSYAWKTLRNLGVPTAGGSDCPIESLNPILGIYSSITRQDLDGNPKGGWLPDEKLSVEEAVKLYTIGSAYASFDEAKKGTIEERKLADMVVLSEDPFEVMPEEVKDIEAVATIMGGQIRHIKDM